MILHVDPEQIGCAEVRKFLYEYVERELDPRVMMAMDNHVLACESCRKQIDSYRLSIDSARITLKRDDRIPDDFKMRIVRTLRGTVSKDE